MVLSQRFIPSKILMLLYYAVSIMLFQDFFFNIYFSTFLGKRISKAFHIGILYSDISSSFSSYFSLILDILISSPLHRSSLDSASNDNSKDLQI